MAAQQESEADAYRLKTAIVGIKADHGFTTVFDFLERLFATNDPRLSSQVTKLIDTHGQEILAAMPAQSGAVDEWAIETTLKTVAEEGRKLAKMLRPPEGRLTVLLEAKQTAPTICLFLRAAGMHSEKGTVRKDRDIMSVSSRFINSVFTRTATDFSCMTSYICHGLACGQWITNWCIANELQYSQTQKFYGMEADYSRYKLR